MGVLTPFLGKVNVKHRAVQADGGWPSASSNVDRASGACYLPTIKTENEPVTMEPRGGRPPGLGGALGRGGSKSAVIVNRWFARTFYLADSVGAKVKCPNTDLRFTQPLEPIPIGLASYAVHGGFLRNSAFSLGVLLGVCFSGIGLAWLLLANRMPHLDQFESERNVALAVAFVGLGCVPTCRFIKSPGRSFPSGVTAWAILTLTYSVAELPFPRIAARLSAFRLFVLGSLVFGLFAAFSRVMNLVVMLCQARKQTIDQRTGFRYLATSR